MKQDYYRFIISPETIKGDFSATTYNNQSVGYYVPMSSILSGGTDGSSLLTGLTVDILLRQNTVDIGYYSPFDGAVYQKDVVSNFIFSSTTEDPYRYYIYNTSSEFQKFLGLSNYVVDWGDGSPEEPINKFTPNNLSHLYPQENNTYTIKLTQTNPWGINIVEKKITTPFVNVQIPNPNGEAFFVPKGGNWSGTPISYDYIFSGDSVNEIEPQESKNYITVPFNISGTTKSRITELKLYGDRSNMAPLYNQHYQLGVPVIANGQVWGAITNVEIGAFTAYTIQDVDYYDYQNGTTLFFEQSSGLTENNITAVPITKDGVLMNVVDQPQIQSNVYVERGKISAYEKIQRMGEVDNLGDMINYGYGFFKIENKG
jgi:hypothetical protein